MKDRLLTLALAVGALAAFYVLFAPQRAPSRIVAVVARGDGAARGLVGGGTQLKLARHGVLSQARGKYES